jgi:hypothetical protein
MTLISLQPTTRTLATIADLAGRSNITGECVVTERELRLSELLSAIKLDTGHGERAGRSASVMMS